jgi:hypothetical protein
MESEKIKDYSSYNEGMKKSLLDKIFFIDKIDAEVIIDFGCADGTLIHFLHSLFPEYKYIGYDTDEEMLTQARKKFNEDDSVYFFSDWEDIEPIAILNKKTAIILSSVIHEVYAYGTRKDVDLVWERVFNSHYKYIIIRDMIPSISIDKKSDINDIKNVLRKGDSGQLRDFEQIWGSVEQNKNLIHYLLKYRYTNNWDREVKENYFPLTREELLRSIPDKYSITFHEHFILPFIRKKVKEDFDIEIKDNTHIKLILESQ